MDYRYTGVSLQALIILLAVAIPKRSADMFFLDKDFFYIQLYVHTRFFMKQGVSVKPWPNGHTSQRFAFNLRFVWPPTCIDLRQLALTLVELKFGRKFFTVWPPSASQHKLIASNLLL